VCETVRVWSKNKKQSPNFRRFVMKINGVQSKYVYLQYQRRRRRNLYHPLTPSPLHSVPVSNVILPTYIVLHIKKPCKSRFLNNNTSNIVSRALTLLGVCCTTFQQNDQNAIYFSTAEDDDDAFRR